MVAPEQSTELDGKAQGCGGAPATADLLAVRRVQGEVAAQRYWVDRGRQTVGLGVLRCGTTAGGGAGGRTTHACPDPGTGAGAAAVSMPARLSILRTPEGERDSRGGVWRRLRPSPLRARTGARAPEARGTRGRRSAAGAALRP